MMLSNPDMAVTLAVFTGAALLLITNWIRGDQVALLVVLVLMVSRVLTVPEALSGFSSPVVVIISSMFIISEAIVYTGIAQRIGEQIIERGGTSETRLMSLLMLSACLVGSIMSSTATVAIFVPVVMAVAEKANLNHRRLLMPLAVGALISGMMTLVATTPNIVVNNALSAYGQEKLSFFSFTPFGVLVGGAALLFMIAFGRRLLDVRSSLPSRRAGRSIVDLINHYRIEQDFFLLVVPAGSPMADRAVVRLQLRENHEAKLIGLQTTENGVKTVKAIRPETIIKAGDTLAVVARPEQAEQLIAAFGLRRRIQPMDPSQRKQFLQVIGAAEVMLTPESNLIGKTVKDSAFQTLFHCLVLGIRRKGEAITEHITEIPLQFGDVLLVSGAWKDILQLKDHRDQYLLLTLPQDHREVIPEGGKATLTCVVLAAMVGLMVFNLVPNVVAVLGAAAALILFRCVNPETYYRVIEWKTVMLIAGILPLALALQKTGAAALAAEFILQTFGGSNPLLILSVLFLLTVTLGLFISNTPTAVLVAPVAVDIGMQLQISPQACAMIVAIACSAAFVSPVGSPVNMVVREPGAYGVMDYLKVGVPLLLCAMVIAVSLAWVIYLR